MNIMNFTPLITCSMILEEAKWSRGDRGRPARAHKIKIVAAVTLSDGDSGISENVFDEIRNTYQEAS